MKLKLYWEMEQEISLHTGENDIDGNEKRETKGGKYQEKVLFYN